MFILHEKVVYPGHGVAEIVGIVEKEVAGQKTSYYELKFINQEMMILVPMDVGTVPIRSLSSRETIRNALQIFTQPARRLNSVEFNASSWNKRNKGYQIKLRNGGLDELSEIYRDLRYFEMHKDLSFGEKNLLQKAEILLAEELALIEQIELKQAVQFLRSLSATSNKEDSLAAFFSVENSTSSENNNLK